jgi:hypothetical protein
MDMLGDLISEARGKITGQRVLDISAAGTPRIETSISGEGKIQGNIEHKEMWTFWSEQRPGGVQYGEGIGVTMTKDGDEVVTITGRGIGRMTEHGTMRYAASNFSRTASSGKLAFLNNMVTVAEFEVDKDNNYHHKQWEWK